MDGAGVAQGKQALFDIAQHFFRPVAELAGGMTWRRSGCAAPGPSRGPHGCSRPQLSRRRGRDFFRAGCRARAHSACLRRIPTTSAGPCCIPRATGCACRGPIGRADEDGTAGRHQAVEQGGGRLARHRMQCPAMVTPSNRPTSRGRASALLSISVKSCATRSAALRAAASIAGSGSTPTIRPTYGRSPTPAARAPSQGRSGDAACEAPISGKRPEEFGRIGRRNFS